MVTFVCNTEYKKGKTTLMINKRDGRQFMSDVCAYRGRDREREKERESYKMQVRGTTFVSQRISPFVNP